MRELLGSRVVDEVRIVGGSINVAKRVTLGDGRVVFVKEHPRSGFDLEARGLAWLAEADALRIPRVLDVGDTWLALEWLEAAPRARDFDEQLGRGLARLHQTGAPCFGLDYDNLLATLPQDNTPSDDAATFWIDRRLRPLARREDTWLQRVNALARVLPDLIPSEPPARLHGDLWNGNVHTDDRGAPALIDPAVYGGPREIDLAMLALFGGLTPRTLAAYQEVTPLAHGWRDRVPLWQTYPLLVHATLFGGGYGTQFERAIDRYL